MEARIEKWGNSLAVRIPRSMADQIDLREESLVTLTVNGGELTISSIVVDPKTLEQLLEKIADTNLHDEVDFGPPVGKEVW